MDSQANNKITYKYMYPKPRIDDILNQLHGSTMFFNINLRIGYLQIGMRDGGASDLIPLTNPTQSMFIQEKAEFNHNLLRWVDNEVVDKETID